VTLFKDVLKATFKTDLAEYLLNAFSRIDTATPGSTRAVPGTSGGMRKLLNQAPDDGSRQGLRIRPWLSWKAPFRVVMCNREKGISAAPRRIEAGAKFEAVFPGGLCAATYERGVDSP